MNTEIGLTKHTQAFILNPPDPYKYDKPLGQRITFTKAKPVRAPLPEMPTKGMNYTTIILTYMPTFCWLTFGDLFNMLAFLEPELEPKILQGVLCVLHKKGAVVSKKWEHPTRPQERGPTPLLYRRAE